MGVSTIQQFVRQILAVLWTVHQPKVLVLSNTAEQWVELINEFDKQWQFPNCFGAIDGKHVLIQVIYILGQSIIFHSKPLRSIL